MFLLLSTLLAIAGTKCSALAPSSPVSSLLQTHADTIQQLKQIAEDKYPSAATDANDDSMFYLRYCIKEGQSDDERTTLLEKNLAWRAGPGKDIVKAAQQAVEAASTSSAAWDNEPVREMAPHGSIVNKYITPSQCLTTTIRSGDLMYCIRAGQIDDVALMSEVSVDQMTEFFLYCKEVNAIVANKKSISTDKVVELLTANDLNGVKLVGGDATFRKALSAASTQANDLYPALAGPTFLLNLPRLLGALVKLFTPLFPEEVRQRLKFQRGPLNDVTNMEEISPGPNGNPSEREKFLDEIDALLIK